MERLKEFCTSKKLTWFLLGIGTVIVALFYAYNAKTTFTVWELVDEYGYLANAAYLSGTDWAFLTNMYYGYGYSICLIPLFWICNSGIGIIRGAILVNAVMVTLMLWVQYALMSKLLKNVNKNIIALMAIAFCFYPNMVSCGMKVISECALSLMIWVCGLLLYQALSTSKIYYYILLAVALVYTYFIHSRAIVFAAVLVLVLGIMFIQKKVSVKNLIAFGVTGIIFFVAGYLLQQHIIDVVYAENILASATEGESATGNTLSVAYIFEKIWGLITNLSPEHIYGFIARNFYLFVSTAGMFHIGLFASFKEAIVEIKEEKQLGIENAVKVMFALAAVLMIVATVVQMPGFTDSTAYFFYGRYYEYLVYPVAFAGVGYCMKNKLHISGIVILLVAFLAFYWGTLDLANILDAQEFYFDSNRIAGFSYATAGNYYYRAVIRVCFKVTLLLLASVLVMNRVKVLRWMMPVLLLGLFLVNDSVIVENIRGLQAKNMDEYNVAAYVHMHYDNVEEVYFLNSDHKYVSTYAALQSLLGQEKLVVIDAEDMDMLEPGDVVVCYHNNPYIEELVKIKLLDTNAYQMFIIE